MDNATSSEMQDLLKSQVLMLDRARKQRKFLRESLQEDISDIKARLDKALSNDRRPLQRAS